MVLYVYRCRVCDDVVEVRHSIYDDPVVVCDGCGGERFRVPSKFGVSLKGDGWAGKRSDGVGVEGKVPPARPVELGGTLDTGRGR